MAQVETFNGSKILVKIGDGADPEVFSHPCLINSSRSIQGSVTTVDSVVPDCADPDAPAWTEREKDAISYTISGEGLMNRADIGPYLTWLKAAANKNVQAVIADGLSGAYVLSGAFHLTEFQISGNRKEKATVSITLVSDGVVAEAAQA
jgi:hypothetical protein